MRDSRWDQCPSFRFTALAFAAFLAVFLAGCKREPPPTDGAGERGGTLRIAVLESFSFLSPVPEPARLTSEFLWHITPPLGRVNEQGYVDPLLASRQIESPEGLGYVLRPARWEDGTPVTARDFVLTSRVLLHPAQPWPAARRFQFVDSLLALNDSTLFFRLMTYSPSQYEDCMIAPLPAHVLGDAVEPPAYKTWSAQRRPLACGPFRVVAASPYTLALVRNDNSDFPAAFVDSVVVRYQTPVEAVQAFRAGDIDVLDDVPLEDVRALLDVRGARLVALVGRSYVFVGWNLRDGRFADAAVRTAAAHGVDVQSMIDALTLGQGARARGPLVPAMGYADTTRTLELDTRRAQALLDEAGWRVPRPGRPRLRRGSRLEFHLLAPDHDSLRVAVARAVARDLGSIGMLVHVRILSNEDFVERVATGAFEAYVGHWYPNLAVELEPVWHSSSTDQRNFGAYTSARADSMLVRLRHENRRFARDALLLRFQQQVYADQPYLFLLQPPRFVAYSARVHGAKPNTRSAFWNLPEWWIPRRLQRQASARA